MSKANEIMRSMGFSDNENGPFVSQLRKNVEKQVANGLVRRSGGTWAPECFDEKGRFTITAEDRAKAMLAYDWALEREHSFRVECIDGFEWRYAHLWLGDRWREFRMNLRVWRDKIFRIKNPYE